MTRRGSSSPARSWIMLCRGRTTSRCCKPRPRTRFCTHHPLGSKGVGETGAIGSPPAVINAVVDALRDYGVRHLDMPATPQKIWSILQSQQPRMAAE